MTREEAVEVLKERYLTCVGIGLDNHANRVNEAIDMAIEALSAEAVPQSEQYKKGFEDAKRAFLFEYARESENMSKRNAQLEVMLNAQKAISAEAVQGWITCSERLPEKDELVLVTVWDSVSIAWRNIYGGWESAEDMYEKGDVIAWMPLPKPYREDGEA